MVEALGRLGRQKLRLRNYPCLEAPWVVGRIPWVDNLRGADHTAFDPAASGLVADTARGKVVEGKHLRAVGWVVAASVARLPVVVPGAVVVVRRPVGVAGDFVESSRTSL